MAFKFNPRLVFSLLLLFLVVFAVKSFAATNPLIQYKNLYKSNTPSMEVWNNGYAYSTAYSLFDMGMDLKSIPDNVLSGIPFDQNGKHITWIPGGAVGTMNNMVASLQTPAASGIEYIAQLKDNLLGIPAYAADTGTQGLLPLLPIWQSFRNIVYILSSLIFVILGILIILRIKISPQAVITIQSAIPQIITTLILVTFSYAIAGLVIDLLNLIQGLVVAMFFTMNGKSFTDNLFGQQIGSGFPILSDIGNFVQSVYQWMASAAGRPAPLSFQYLANPDFNTFNMLTFRAGPSWVSTLLLGGLIGNIISGAFLGGVGHSILGGLGGDIGNGLGGVVGGLVGGAIGGILIPLILTIIITIWIIKLYFGLIKAYVTIIFKIILAPLEIGLGAFPGSKTGFSTWLWELVANAAVFPVINIFLILLNFIIDKLYAGFANVGTAMWAPGAISGSFISSGAVSTAIIAGAIGLAGLSLLAKLPDMVPQYIFMIKPSPWGTAVGQSLSESDPRRSTAYKFGKSTLANQSSTNISTGTGRLGADIKRYSNKLFGAGGADSVAEATKQLGK